MRTSGNFNQTLVFIDESGDGGFKFDKSSSRYFVISLIIFDDTLEAEKTAVAIKELRRTLGFGDHIEFKFNKSRRVVREQFLRAVNPFQFRVRSLVIDKKILYSPMLRNNINEFYSYAIKLVLKHSPVVGASIKIDGSGGREFRRSFLVYLRKQLNSDEKTLMKSVKLIDSKSSVLIQMADMIAGSIHCAKNPERTDVNAYRSIIEHHIEDEWNFQ